MLLYEDLVGVLETLEAQAFNDLLSEFEMTDANRDTITGRVIFASVDPIQVATKRSLPVVVCCGINWTSSGKQTTYLERYGPVVQPTSTGNPIGLTLAAGRRNSDAWYAAGRLSSALATTAIDPEQPYIAVWTNLSPFVTNLKWLDQVKKSGEDACASLLRPSYLDTLYDAIGDRVDLWMPHSALGSAWVFPSFQEFASKHSLENVVYATNLSAYTRLHIDRWMEKKTSKQYDLFKA